LPLCVYTIKAALESGVFDEIHFSSDSEKYISIAEPYGVSVPFVRDKSLAEDTSSSWDVVKDVIRNYEKIGRFFDAVMLLQPTVPFRSAEDIRNAVDLFKEKNANAVVSVTTPEHSPLWSAPLGSDGNMRIFHERFQYLTARQNLEKYYALNGAIYLADIKYLMESQDIYEEKCYSYFMPRERSFDIDDQLDFDWCEYILSQKSKKESQKNKN
jgi:CMP-N,N'-diacetyllegionaminic acid synthase